MYNDSYNRRSRNESRIGTCYFDECVHTVWTIIRAEHVGIVEKYSECDILR